MVRLNENEPSPKTKKYFERTNDGKLLLRKVLGRYAVAEAVEREKQGFSAPDASWFRGESIDYVRDRLLEPFRAHGSTTGWTTALSPASSRSISRAVATAVCSSGPCSMSRNGAAVSLARRRSRHEPWHMPSVDIAGCSVLRRPLDAEFLRGQINT